MPDRIPNFFKSATKVFFGFALIVSIGLWIWNLAVPYRTLPSLGLRTPVGVFQLCSDRSGLHMLALGHESNRGFAISGERVGPRYSGPRYYRLGSVLQALGFTVAVVPTTFRDGDNEITRHLALVLPYWFLITSSCFAFLWATGLLGPLLARLRFSRWSKVALAMVLLLFFALNVIPSASRPGAKIRPAGIFEWITLIVCPETRHPAIQLNYGFPFICNRTAFINGRAVGAFLGDDLLEWRQEKVMENLIIALLSALAVGMAVERLMSSLTTDEPQPHS